MKENNDSDREIVLKFDRKVINIIISKVIVLLSLAYIGGYFVSKEAIKELEVYENVSIEKCAKEVCIDEVLAYKKSLEPGKSITDPYITILAMTILVAILFGTYELLALLIELAIRKIMR